MTRGLWSPSRSSANNLSQLMTKAAFLTRRAVRSGLSKLMTKAAKLVAQTSSSSPARPTRLYVCAPMFPETFVTWFVSVIWTDM